MKRCTPNSVMAACLTATTLALASCSGGVSGTSGAEATEGSGTVGLALSLPGGTTLSNVTYVVTGPNAFSRNGSINVGSSSTISAQLSLPAGGPYSVTLTGVTTDTSTTCTGTAQFSVTAGQTIGVSVHLTCREAPKTGSAQVNGNINVCPVIDGVTASPLEAFVGATISLTAAGHDTDSGPSPLSYSWTSSSGMFSSATIANPKFTCTEPGTATVTLKVSDGDPATGCAPTQSVPVTCTLGDPAWVELASGGQAIARLITASPVCPSIVVDGVPQPMSLRIGPGTEPLRPTSSDPVVNPSSPTSKPSFFPVTTCEFPVPAGAHTLSLAGKSLPLPKADVERVVIVGDTGCRVSNGNPWQNCNDWTQWPFPVIAQAAAAMKPDLVLHVGDFHYRDNACPDDTLGCSGPWGYGYDVWAADFFLPSAPLFAAAPWVIVRGNHEVCNRAGQGWYRFLDTNPYAETKSCNDPANDNLGNYNDPFAVPFDDTQFIVFDSSNVTKSPLSPATKPADVFPFNTYQAELHSAANLTATQGVLSIFAVHHPLLGFTPGTPATGGNPALLSVMAATYPTAYYPPGVGLAVHGHVHDFQGINFASGHPSTFVAGHGGDNLDVALPDPFPSGLVPAANTVVESIAHSVTFGFLVMDRVGPAQWKFTAFRRDGSILTVCDMLTAPFSGSGSPTPGRQIHCANTGPLM